VVLTHKSDEYLPLERIELYVSITIVALYILSIYYVVQFVVLLRDVLIYWQFTGRLRWPADVMRA